MHKLPKHLHHIPILRYITQILTLLLQNQFQATTENKLYNKIAQAEEKFFILISQLHM